MARRGGRALGRILCVLLVALLAPLSAITFASAGPDGHDHCAPDHAANHPNKKCGADSKTWFRDHDGDGHGNEKNRRVAEVAPDNYVALDDDCDDHDAAVHPNADETYNGIDDDCDGDIDEDYSAYYADLDGDGHGAGDPTYATTQPDDHVSTADDCDDEAAHRFPGNPEIVGNDVDEDCDGHDLKAWYRDADGDGHGDPAADQLGNTAPDGHVASADDCDDAKASTHPGAHETYNGVDDDCDGDIDEDYSAYYPDTDGDSYGQADATATYATEILQGYSADNSDCDDNNAATHPNADETYNGIDDDCDGDIDEAFSPFYADLDGDGHGAGDPAYATAKPAGHVGLNDDCDDTRDSIYPGAPELEDGLDNDCDTVVPEGVDGDGDGFYTTGQTPDCDDADKHATTTCVDTDKDGQKDVHEEACGSNPLDAESLAQDTDADAVPDCVDEDDDNDGVLDGEDAYPSDPTRITNAPVLNDRRIVVAAGATRTLKLTGLDPDNDPLTVSVSDVPEGLTLTTTDGVQPTITVTAPESGTWRLPLRVADHVYDSQAVLEVIVSEAIKPVALANDQPTVMAGIALALEGDFSEPVVGTVLSTDDPSMLDDVPAQSTLGQYYDFDLTLPAGVKATFTLSYDDDAAEQDLRIFYWAGDRWVDMKTAPDALPRLVKGTTAAYDNTVHAYVHDLDANTITIKLDHFSTYGLGTPMPEPAGEPPAAESVVQRRGGGSHYPVVVASATIDPATGSLTTDKLHVAAGQRFASGADEGMVRSVSFKDAPPGAATLTYAVIEAPAPMPEGFEGSPYVMDLELTAPGPVDIVFQHLAALVASGDPERLVLLHFHHGAWDVTNGRYDAASATFTAFGLDDFSPFAFAFDNIAPSLKVRLDGDKAVADAHDNRGIASIQWLQHGVVIAEGASLDVAGLTGELEILATDASGLQASQTLTVSRSEPLTGPYQPAIGNGDAWFSAAALIATIAGLVASRYRFGIDAAAAVLRRPGAVRRTARTLLQGACIVALAA